MTTALDKSKLPPAINAEIRQSIELLESAIQDPTKGLPKDVFLFATRITPMINVDLLIRNERNETLLTWREDEYYGPGWHVPGGIIRFKETVATRIRAVAACELGASVEFKKEPLAINEIMNTARDTRGHFISLLYNCVLTSPLDPAIEYKTGPTRNGQWAWHAGCPVNLITVQEMYRWMISG